MSRPLACIAFCLLVLGAAGVQAAEFDLLPTYDTYVSNDPSEGPDTSHETGSGMHARDITDRRRVAYVTYDLSEVKGLGAFFSNVRFSNYGHNVGTVNVYGVLESQFRIYFKEAERQKGVTGYNLILLLERRLDNVVYRMGFAGSRNQARQLVRHGHFRVNGKKVNIPSYLVAAGDTVEVKAKSQKSLPIATALESLSKRGGAPRWIDLDAANLKGVLKEYPTREDITMPIDEQLIVELYSK